MRRPRINNDYLTAVGTSLGAWAGSRGVSISKEEIKRIFKPLGLSARRCDLVHRAYRNEVVRHNFTTTNPATVSAEDYRRFLEANTTR